MKRELTEKQTIFLDNLIENGGHVSNAMEIAGYNKNSRSNLINSLKHEIVERTRQHLASSSMQAANRLIEGLDADGTIPSSQMDVLVSVTDRRLLQNQKYYTALFFYQPRKNNKKYGPTKVKTRRER